MRERNAFDEDEDWNSSKRKKKNVRDDWDDKHWEEDEYDQEEDDEWEDAQEDF
ncbi:hypothetical protein JW835_13430 [bacterium]|nr:hypothetical protein [bacterium]